MPVVPVAEFIPDAAALGNPGSIRIVNAVPGTTSYKPFQSFSSSTSAIDSRPRGGISARDRDNNVFNYVGDETKLYVQSGMAWNDVSKTGGYSTADLEVWEFVQWKNKVLATNWSDSPQQISLGGTNFSDLTTDLRARHIAVVRDFVVVGNTFDGTDGNVPDRVRWSAFNDETDWTVSQSTLSDFQDLKSGGWVQRIIGGEYGVVVSERSTFRMTFVGSPVVFQIDEVLPGVGAIAPGTVVNLGSTVFFWSEQGIVALTGATGLAFPAAGKLDKFIRDDLDPGHLHRISSVADPRGGRVYWAYPGAGNTAGRPNRLLLYDTTLNKFALIETDVELIWRSAAVGQTLDSLDAISGSIDALEVSLDSPEWVGGTPNFSAFDGSFEQGFFTGENMTATIDTKEAEIHSGYQVQLNAFRALVDGGTVQVRVGTRDRQTDPVTFGPLIDQRSSGRYATRDRARYHRFRMEISGDWQDAIGIEIDRADARRAGQRG